MINWYLPNLSKVYKISIIPRSKGSLGYNINLPRNYSLYTKEQLMNMITGLLGGRLAEEMYLGKVTTGSYNDLQKVNDLAKEMVMKYGMSDLGLISFDNKERYSFIKPFSYTMENKIEIECQKIIENCVQKGKMILKEKQKEETAMKLGVETIWQDRKRVLGMPLTFTKYFLSEDRLFLQTGVLNMKMEEVLLYRVSDIGVHVSLGQRIFGVGTIIIHSSDKSAPHLELKNVKNPLVVKELIHKHVESMKTERGVRVSEFLDDGPKRHDPCTPPPKMEH